ncbi:MAG: glucose-1-phosphate thymidylyltransferase [Gammaproteobacteria bacterium]|nr:MAG: glucose-1-phosphate thymidylyltransferase [Gammaproteobacteria bacterium]
MTNRKGIILAGGSGSRLHPITDVSSKQLLPVYDKPMIYYPLSILMAIGIKDILIISSPMDMPRYKSLLGNGKKWGINFSFKIQKKPNGIAQALILGEKFLKSDPSCLILGDNLFHGKDLLLSLKKADQDIKNASVVTYPVKNPQRFGVLEKRNNKPYKIIEKPKKPKSKRAITGIYFYPENVSKEAKKLIPSKRGELEISDLNQFFLKINQLSVTELGKNSTWLDCGTFDSLLKASNFVAKTQLKQQNKIACLEEIAYKNKWISKKKVLEIIEISSSSYGKYLKQVIS